ncbi:hypothetical protein YPPY14_1101, partial [Yersinia pestis PY-14]
MTLRGHSTGQYKRIRIFTALILLK